MPSRCSGAEVRRGRCGLACALPSGHHVTVATLTGQLTVPSPASVSPPRSGGSVVPTPVSCTHSLSCGAWNRPRCQGSAVDVLLMTFVGARSPDSLVDAVLPLFKMFTSKLSPALGIVSDVRRDKWQYLRCKGKCLCLKECTGFCCPKLPALAGKIQRASLCCCICRKRLPGGWSSEEVEWTEHRHRTPPLLFSCGLEILWKVQAGIQRNRNQKVRQHSEAAARVVRRRSQQETLVPPHLK